MATNLQEWETPRGSVSVTQFAGGQDRGLCLQVTSPEGFCQLTHNDVVQAVEVFSQWHERRKRGRMNPPLSKSAPDVARVGHACEICGKSQSPYPNWIVSKGRQMHVGCMADALDLYDKQRKFLMDRCIAGGHFGPFCDSLWDADWQKLWDEMADDQFNALGTK